MPTAIKPAIVILAIACTPPLALFVFGRLWSLDVVWMSLIIIALVSAPFVVGFATSKLIGYRDEKGAMVVVLGSIVFDRSLEFFDRIHDLLLNISRSLVVSFR